jgi:hypothetical protein
MFKRDSNGQTVAMRITTLPDDKKNRDIDFTFDSFSLIHHNLVWEGKKIDYYLLVIDF